ncbi:MAG: type II toxin-antitoxin system death-on-curing family toxin [bacterium]
MQYLTLEEVLYLHSRIVKRTGGRAGVRELSLLESAVFRPASTFGGKDLYPDLFTKAAAILHSLVNNHPFTDGNKRTAYVAASRFLFINGHVLRVPAEGVIDFLLEVEAKTLALDGIARWLKRHSIRRRGAR